MYIQERNLTDGAVASYPSVWGVEGDEAALQILRMLRALILRNGSKRLCWSSGDRGREVIVRSAVDWLTRAMDHLALMSGMERAATTERNRREP